MRSTAFLLCAGLAACPEPAATDDDGTTDETDLPAQDTSGCSVGPNWTTVGAPFIYTWCTPCHAPGLATLEERQDAPLKVNFGTYEDVVEWEARIDVRIHSEDEPMPPAGGPTPNELDAVSHWIGCGLPE